MEKVCEIQSEDHSSDKINERCVVCGFELLHTPRFCHIHDPRRNGNYIEGVGQLCSRCASISTDSS
jgi:CRISPR/Cas system-associated protein Cas10 (large subunit of type III CRISPR-Cas system)